MALPRMLTTCIQPSSKTIAVTHHNARKEKKKLDEEAVFNEMQDFVPRNNISFTKKPKKVVSKKQEKKKHDKAQFSKEHLQNVQIFKNAWKELDVARQQSQKKVVTFEVEPEILEHLKKFKPLDLEEFWMNNFLMSAESSAVEKETN